MEIKRTAGSHSVKGLPAGGIGAELGQELELEQVPLPPTRITQKQVGLDAEITPHLAPPGRFPAIDLELLGIVVRSGHDIGWGYGLVGGDVFRPQVEHAAGRVPAISQAVDGEAQGWQHFVIDDIVEEYGVGIECISRQDHAIGKRLVVADGLSPGMGLTSL